MVLLLTACINEVEFEEFGSIILVRNMPKDQLEKSKIMIAYYNSVGLSCSEFIDQYLDKDVYIMSFLKSTRATLKYNNKVERNLLKGLPPPRVRQLRGSETQFRKKSYLGRIRMSRCENDSTKCMISIFVDTGVSEDGWLQTDRTVLFNECDDGRYWNKVDYDNELVKYFMELRSKRNDE
jgi:hypothetical protein